MTTNAVNWKNAQLNREVDKEIAALDRKVDFQKLGISADELKEKIRHNQIEEYLKEKEVNASDRNGFMSGLGSIFRGIGMGGALGGLAAAVNDESYHNKLVVAYDQATNLPFSEKAGNPNYWLKAGLGLYSDEGHSVLSSYDDKYNPNSGIVHVRYVPTISVNDQEIQSSELQNNVRILFSKVRSANSGAVNQYDQSDLMQFTLASSSVFEILRLFVRPLNYLCAKRKSMNVFTAWDETILTIMCGSAANARKVINERTEYIQAINSAIRANNSQVLPIGFDLTKRRSLLNGRIFTKSGDRDEIYIFTPTCYYVYDEANAKLLSKQLNLASVFSSPDALKAVLNEMLQPLVNGTATSIMAGDMKKAYSRQVQLIRELPYTMKGDIYSEDEHILEALRNANIMSGLDGYGSQFDIKQGVNTLLDTYIYQGALIGNKAVLLSNDADINDYVFFFDQIVSGDTLTYKNYLDVKKDNPEKYDIMAGTRFKTSFEVKLNRYEDEEDGWYSRTYVTQWGTEIILGVEITYFSTNADFSSNSPFKLGLNGCNLQEIIDFDSDAAQRLMFYQRFHYLPMLFKQWVRYDSGSYLQLMDFVHGRYNGITLTDKQLMNLNNASFGSLISILETNQNDVE